MELTNVLENKTMDTQKATTEFIEMPCPETSSVFNLRSGWILTCPLTPEEAVKKYLSSEKRLVHYELAVTYTVGYEGQEDHIWDFSHYQIYKPVDLNLPSLIILRYRRRNFQQQL